MDRSHFAKLGHITRQLNDKGILSEKALETALMVIEKGKKGFSDEDFLDNLSMKLKNEEPLDDYEYHIMVDVLLLHERIRIHS